MALSTDLTPEFHLMCVFITEQVRLEEAFGDELVQLPSSSRTKSQLTKTNFNIYVRKQTPWETGASAHNLKTTVFLEIKMEPPVFSLCAHFSLCPECEPKRRPFLHPLCIFHSGVYMH